MRGKDSSGYVLTRYSEESVKISEAHFSDSTYRILHGKEILYRASGTFVEVRVYLKNKLIQQEYYYENGNKKLSKVFSDSIHNYVWQDYWDSSGVQLMKNGDGILQLRDRNISESGEVHYGVRHGKWKGQLLNKDLSFIELYENNKLMGGRSVTSDKKKHTYRVRKTEPGYPRRPQKLMKSIRNISFGPLPPDVLYVDVALDEKGKVEEAAVRGNWSDDVKNNVIDVVKKYARWIPGTEFGIPVKTSATLSIRISKEDE